MPFDYHFTFWLMGLLTALVLALSCVLSPKLNRSQRAETVVTSVMRVETYSDDEHLIA